MTTFYKKIEELFIDINKYENASQLYFNSNNIDVDENVKHLIIDDIKLVKIIIDYYYNSFILLYRKNGYDMTLNILSNPNINVISEIMNFEINSTTIMFNDIIFKWLVDNKYFIDICGIVCGEHLHKLI